MGLVRALGSSSLTRIRETSILLVQALDLGRSYLTMCGFCLFCLVLKFLHSRGPHIYIYTYTYTDKHLMYIYIAYIHARFYIYTHICKICTALVITFPRGPCMLYIVTIACHTPIRILLTKAPSSNGTMNLMSRVSDRTPFP